MRVAKTHSFSSASLLAIFSFLIVLGFHQKIRRQLFVTHQNSPLPWYSGGEGNCYLEFQSLRSINAKFSGESLIAVVLGLLKIFLPKIWLLSKIALDLFGKNRYSTPLEEGIP